MFDRRIVLKTLLILLVIIGVCFLIADINSPEDIGSIEELVAPLEADIRDFDSSWTSFKPEQYNLSSEMKETYTEQANNGDGNAAYILGMYYLNFTSDALSAIYWFEKGIELHNMDCLFKLANLFVYSNHDQERATSVQYFKCLLQEAEDGNEEATKYLDRIPDEIKEEFYEEK